MHSKTMTLLAVAFGLGFAHAASAADMPVKAAPMVAPTYNWTGCYVGANAGGGWGNDDWTFVSGTPGNGPHFNGGLAGGQFGCDYQWSEWVVGLAGMVDWARLNGSAVSENPAFATNTKVTSFYAATARLGYAVQPALLFYVDGGAAWTHNQRYYVPTLGPTVTDTRLGWTVGLGLEYMFAPRWSAKIEYNYADFGTTGPEPIDLFDGPAGNVNVRQRINTVLVGVNFRFGK